MGTELRKSSTCDTCVSWFSCKMGVRHANGSKGDLIAEVQIALPSGADPAAVERLLEAAKATEAAASANPRAQLKW